MKSLDVYFKFEKLQELALKRQLFSTQEFGTSELHIGRSYGKLLASCQRELHFHADKQFFLFS